jgi:hypothetical protein
MILLLIPGKVNFASAWENHTTDHEAQNGGSRTATLDNSAGDELSASSISPWGHECGMSMHEETTTTTNVFAVRINITGEQGSRKCLMNTSETPFVAG